MCTPFYVDAVNFLNPLVTRHKIASGWLKNPSIFRAACETGKQVIASLGMMDDGLPFRYRHIPNVSYLHCVSLYPCPDKKAHLNGIRRKWVSGYSDHTDGIVACVASSVMGAKIIEKHLTLDRHAEGPDHACSAEPDEFSEMVRQIRRLEKILQ